MKKVCYIVSAGDASPDFLPVKKEGDLLIAADAGYEILRAADIEPDLFIGDGDSLGYIPEFKDRTVLPCEKDDTDTHAAIKLGFERGFERFVIYGALGGERFSHSLANLQCLSYIAKRGGKGAIADRRCTVRLIPGGAEHRFHGTDGYFSLFPFGDDAVVSVKGAKYETDKTAIPFASILGVSNEPRGECSVAVHEGTVLFVREPGDKVFFD